MLNTVTNAYRFAPGASVDHIDGGMEGFIAERALMGDGSDAYVVWRTFDDDGRYAFVYGDELVPLEKGDEIHEAFRANLWSAAS